MTFPDPPFCVCLSLKVMDAKAVLMSRGWATRQPATSVPIQLQLLLWPWRRHLDKLEDSTGTHSAERNHWSCSQEGWAGSTVHRLHSPRAALERLDSGHGAPSLCLVLRSPVYVLTVDVD